MAGNADGVIRIDAEMDTSGFQKNSQRLESAITSFSQKINTLGRQMEEAIANGATQKQLDSMKLKMAGAEESMQNLQSKFRDLSNTIVSTKQFEDLEKAIGKTQEQLNKLYDKELFKDIRFLKKDQLVAKRELRVIDEEDQSIARRRNRRRNPRR